MSCECDDDLSVQKKFDDVTRKKLLDKFASEYCKDVSVSEGSALYEARIFLGCLEKNASLPWPDAENQNRRRERLEALANALDSIADIALGMDDSSLGFAIYSGLAEMMKGGDFSESDRASLKAEDGYPIVLFAYLLQHEQKENIKSFCLGVRNAIKALPALDKNHADEFQTARFIEDYLARMNINCTTSDTGLAGQAFLSTMELCGQKIGRAGYWLKKAKDHEMSWSNFARKMTDRMESGSGQK